MKCSVGNIAGPRNPYIGIVPPGSSQHAKAKFFFVDCTCPCTCNGTCNCLVIPDLSGVEDIEPLTNVNDSECSLSERPINLI